MEPLTAPLAAPATSLRRPSSLTGILADIGMRLLIVAVVMASLLAALYFPRSNDAALTAAEQAELQKFYVTAYDKTTPAEEEDTRYVQIAEAEADKQEVRANVAQFAQQFGLSTKKVLDIGAGRGYLQDVVSDYTALDISPSVKRFFHKPFVLASATLMPFPPKQFDSAWTIWVLEHVPNPEAALVEMRRVIKDGGLLYLAPAWDCRPWAANGYPVRPYSDFGLAGKLNKASIPMRIYFWNLAKAPVRLVRYLGWKLSGGPIHFRYGRLVPNYDHYWMPDSDAVNSLDRHETALWFLSRGDECLNCEGSLHGLFQENEPLIIRVHQSN